MEKKHIMIVDDEPDVIETARIRLEANGFKVSSSVGLEAVPDILKAKPDLIILDVMMPGADGFAIIRQLKRDPFLAKIPVIVFSAKSKEAMLDLFGPEGVSGYLTKPCLADEMLNQVKKVLGV